ncbi:cytochrome P450 [Gigaspora margarita]|uniref:Cytochrome P450 n=1 Tax=Gigaspora margarita TaxID=4874 RepID=A0A8H4ERP6_GIGMA|nr:cytochrome P450 [Gigaspora margarita]
MHYYLVAFVAFISYALYKYYIYPLYLSPLRKIPGPPPDNFILGHYATFLNKELGEASARLTKQYGGLIRYHGLFNQPHLLIADPELVQKIMINRSYDYPKYFIDKRIAREFLGGDGILLAEGDSHKRQRKMMNPSFAFANVKEMVPTFVQAGHKLKDIWMKQIGNNKEERITITTVIPKITLDVIGLVGFNYEFNSTTSESELAHAYKALVGRNTSFLFRTVESFFPFIRKLPIPYYTDFYDSIKTIKKVSEKLISEQKNSTIQGKDLLSLLVQSNEKLPVDEQLTHNELISQVMILLLAGHETTSTALSWALYFLAKNPDVQDRLRKEVVELFTDRDHFPTFDEIEQLKYLECVFKETLRIVPPVPGLFRTNLNDEILNGYVIPKGTPMLIAIHAIHHDPSIWGNDAEYFNPSRWLDPEIKSKITNSNFIPFSAGPKNCLGMKMAHLELKSILSVIIRNFEFKLVEGFTFKKKLIGIAKPIPGVDLLVSKIDY